MENNQQDQRNKQNPNSFAQLFMGIMIALVFALFIFQFTPGVTSTQSSEITYTEFLKKVDDGDIYKVQIGEDIIAFERINKNATDTITNSSNSLQAYFNANIYRVVKT